MTKEELLNLGDKVDDYLRLYIQKDIPITREQADEINEYKCELKNLIEQQDQIIREARELIESNPLVYMGEYYYYVKDIKQIEEYSTQMSFFRTLEEILDRNVK